jgi:hypothetical protein
MIQDDFFTPGNSTVSSYRSKCHVEKEEFMFSAIFLFHSFNFLLKAAHFQS